MTMSFQGARELEQRIIESEGADETFHIYSEGLLFASVCSSLPQQEVEARMHKVICGTKSGWGLSKAETFEGGQPNPCLCDQKPQTHKHYLFNC